MKGSKRTAKRSSSTCSDSSADTDHLDDEVSTLQAQLWALNQVPPEAVKNASKPQPNYHLTVPPAGSLYTAPTAVGNSNNTRQQQAQPNGGCGGTTTTPTTPIIVNLAMCRYEITCQCCEDMGWTVTHSDSTIECGSVYWTDYSVSSERTAQLLKVYRMVNHFPCMDSITRKIPLAINVTKMQKHFPQEFNFIPRSFVDIADFHSYQETVSRQHSNMNDNEGQNGSTATRGGGVTTTATSARRTCYIIKPNNGAQGCGIHLSFAPPTRSFMANCVVQQYMDNPLLIEGYKFDLRCYVLILSCNPLRIFFYKDGFVRMATELYCPPTEGNIHNLYMHLTNYSINKKSPKFVFNTEDTHGEGEGGSKRSFAFLTTYLKQLGCNADNFWSEVHDLVVKTFICIYSKLISTYQGVTRDIRQGPFPSSNINCTTTISSCFELLGFDIMVDDHFKPWLIEVNHSPSWRVDTPLDLRVKRGVLMESMKLLNLEEWHNNNPNPHNNLHNSHNNGNTSSPPENSTTTKPTTTTDSTFGQSVDLQKPKVPHSTRKKAWGASRDVFENNVLQGFVRIYPLPTAPDSSHKKYDPYFSSVRNGGSFNIGTTGVPCSVVNSDNASEHTAFLQPTPPTNSSAGNSTGANNSSRRFDSSLPLHQTVVSPNKPRTEANSRFSRSSSGCASRNSSSSGSSGSEKHICSHNSPSKPIPHSPKSTTKPSSLMQMLSHPASSYTSRIPYRSRVHTTDTSTASNTVPTAAAAVPHTTNDMMMRRGPRPMRGPQPLSYYRPKRANTVFQAAKSSTYEDVTTTTTCLGNNNNGPRHVYGRSPPHTAPPATNPSPRSTHSELPKLGLHKPLIPDAKGELNCNL